MEVLGVPRECKSTGAGTSEAYTARSAQAKIMIIIIKIQTQIRPKRKEKGKNELDFGRSLSAERERERERERESSGGGTKKDENVFDLMIGQPHYLSHSFYEMTIFGIILF